MLVLALVWHDPAKFSNQREVRGLDAALADIVFVQFWVPRGDELAEYCMLRKRNIMGLVQGKPLPWRWLLVLRSGKWSVPRNPPGRGVHRKSLTPVEGQAFLLV